MPTSLHAQGLVLALCALAPAAQAIDRIELSFNDPAALYSSYYADIQRVTVAAGNSWLDHFLDPGAATALSVQINFGSVATATGRSVTSAFVRNGADGMRVFEQGAAYEIRTGFDSNGLASDIELRLGIDGYLQHELWFDPNPGGPAAAVPAHQTDAYSVLQHEFGHALGFNGWRDSADGGLPGNYLSTFDALVTAQTLASGETVSYFIGAQAVALYGAPVPLTLTNYAHLGNWSPGLGADLLPDLMNGMAFSRGERYEISALDLGVMRDLGLPSASISITAVPEPATWALWLAGLSALVVGQRRAAARGAAHPGHLA